MLVLKSLSRSNEHRKVGGNSDLEKQSGKGSDPLSEFFQMDKFECTPLEKEALVLVTQLLQNVEEYYALQVQITDVMAQDHVIENRIRSLLDALINGLLVEQTFLGREFTGIAGL
jgi:hypothetical protein